MSTDLDHCEWFHNLSGNSGHAGWSIVPVSRAGDRRWYLIAQPFEYEHIDLVRAAFNAAGATGIALELRLPLKFCPAAGPSYRSA